MDKNTLSIAIIAKDEERLIGGCLESIAGVADEIIVLLDSRSRDRTDVLCHAYGASVFHEPWRGYAAQRNRALHLCQRKWVLFIDADERLTPELRQELKTLQPTESQGYWIPRYNIFFDQIVRGGGWYPDHQLRLLQRVHARYNEDQMVHEVALLDGPTERLNGHFLHINIETLGEFWFKQSGYALSEARSLQSLGRKTRWRNFVGAPVRELWRRYIQLEGWRDGTLGLFLCLSLAWFEVVKYACLYLMNAKPRMKQ